MLYENLTCFSPPSTLATIATFKGKLKDIVAESIVSEQEEIRELVLTFIALLYTKEVQKKKEEAIQNLCIGSPFISSLFWLFLSLIKSDIIIR